MSPEDLNNQLIPHLKEIIPKKVTYNAVEAKKYVGLMMKILDTIIKKMKARDPLFKLLYHKRVYTGSYYDGLRITEANEFDWNLVLRLPFSLQDVEVTPSTLPAFVNYRLNRELEDILGGNPKWPPKHRQRLNAMFDNLYLRRDKVHSWFQGMIFKACAEYNAQCGTKKVLPRQSGPAITLDIQVSQRRKIDVDLVPVINCSIYPLPEDFAQNARFRKLKSEDKAWFIVPKPLKNEILLDSHGRTCWRVSFPEAEKKLLEGMNCVKPLIKLFKLLRDTEHWPIDSYIIKGLFFLEVDSHSKKTHWHERRMGVLFVEMLKKFKEAIEGRRVDYFFNTNANLLSQLSEATAENIANRVGKFITLIETKPSNVLGIYKVGNADRRQRLLKTNG